MSSFQAGEHRHHAYDVRASSGSNNSSTAVSPQNADLTLFKRGKMKKKNNKKKAAAEPSPPRENGSSAPTTRNHTGVASEEPADGKNKKKSSAGKKRRDGKMFGGIGKKDKDKAAAAADSKRNSRGKSGGGVANGYGVAARVEDEGFEVYGQLMDAGETDGTQGNLGLFFASAGARPKYAWRPCRKRCFCRVFRLANTAVARTHACPEKNPVFDGKRTPRGSKRDCAGPAQAVV